MRSPLMLTPPGNKHHNGNNTTSGDMKGQSTTRDPHTILTGRWQRGSVTLLCLSLPPHKVPLSPAHPVGRVPQGASREDIQHPINFTTCISMHN